jgi:pilus assembly protein CpaF
MQEIFRFRQSGRDSDGRVLGQFEATGVRPHFAGVLKSMGIYLDPELFKPPMGYGR